MNSVADQNNKLGALWEKISGRGTYMTGKIDPSKWDDEALQAVFDALASRGFGRRMSHVGRLLSAGSFDVSRRNTTSGTGWRAESASITAARASSSHLDGSILPVM